MADNRTKNAYDTIWEAINTYELTNEEVIFLLVRIMHEVNMNVDIDEMESEEIDPDDLTSL